MVFIFLVLQPSLVSDMLTHFHMLVNILQQLHSNSSYYLTLWIFYTLFYQLPMVGSADFFPGFININNALLNILMHKQFAYILALIIKIRSWKGNG